jgi:dihydroorotase
MLAPAGLPLIQHSLSMMLSFYHKGQLSLEFIVDKMSHKVAEMFRIVDRGFLDEGQFADLIIVDLDKEWTVYSSDLLFKCAWGHLWRDNR